MQLLMIEDDLGLLDALSRMLASRGFDVVCCADPAEALQLARRRSFDILLLDLTLPGMDGLDLLQKLRDAGLKTPVMVMTARSAVQDKVIGFDTGADDYVTKPFEIDELVARLKALVRRAQGVEDFRCGQLRLSMETGSISKGTALLDLSQREHAMLKALLLHPNQAIPRERLHQTVFGNDASSNLDAVDVLVHRLRKRLQGCGVTLVTLRGVGYYLMAQES